MSMKRKFGFAAAWLGATIISLVIASAAVAGIRDRVEDSPIAAGIPTTITATADTTTTTGVLIVTTTETPDTTTSSTTSTTTTTTTTEAPETSTSIPGGTTPPSTTTTTEPPPTTTTTTEPPPTTTTTTTVVPTEDRTYLLTGGWVTIRIGDDTVDLISYSPEPGFAAKVKEDGPDKVEVTFTSNTHKSEFKAEFNDGEFEFDIEEEPIGEEDD
jgi:hypothetical protein